MRSALRFLVKLALLYPIGFVIVFGWVGFDVLRVLVARADVWRVTRRVRRAYR